MPLYRLWEIGVDRGVRGLGGGYEDFIELLRIRGDRVKDLDSYLEAYDRIELIQSGPNAVRESIIIAIHRAYRAGGMLQVDPGGEGGQAAPLFNIRRLELRLNPMKRTGAVFLKGKHAGLYDVDRIIKAACEAVEDVELGFKGAIQVGLIFCFGRDMTFDANKTLAKKISFWRTQTDKIVGLDLAGPESVNPLSSSKRLNEMKLVYDLAGKGLGRTVHAGETLYTDMDTFIKTIEALNPQRVAHPIAAFREYWYKDDDRGLKVLQERKIVCELCVKSNLLTGAVKNLQEYRRIIETLQEFGIPYTFSTDAPSLQGTSLADELTALLAHGAATPEQVLCALSTADQCSFLPHR